MIPITSFDVPKSYGSGVGVLRGTVKRYYFRYSPSSLDRLRRALNNRSGWIVSHGPSFDVHTQTGD